MKKDNTMKIQIVCLFAAVGLLAGCAESRQSMGASAENDQNVLTGGPVTGTTLKDLPSPVREALQKQMPRAEVADIDKTTRNGKVVYEISFAEPGKNPKVYISEDGQMLSNSEIHQ
jgi:hypothetical protein